jgi:uncharacterized Zn finger protein
MSKRKDQKPERGTSGRSTRSDGPRRVRNGIKLRARDGSIPSTPLSDRLLDLIRRITRQEEVEEGQRYARLGQTIALDCRPGEVVASVQGRAGRPYETRIRFGAFSPAQWDRIVDAMASEAVYLVKLLDDALPEGIDDLLGGLGLSLLPPTPSDLELSCTCRRMPPCRHIATIAYLLAERLASEPLLVFTLRGLEADRLLDRLRQARTLRARGVAAAHSDPMIPESQEEPVALEACLDEFWRPGPQLTLMQSAPPPQHLSHALLRRLGPSPMNSRFPLNGLLASIYDSVAEYAVRIRDQAEHIEQTEDDGRDAID